MVVKVYKLTAAFPDSEKFGIVSQIRRAAISVSSNLAEGTGRNSAKDQAYFYSIFYSSLMDFSRRLRFNTDRD